MPPQVHERRATAKRFLTASVGGGIGDGATLTHPQSCKQVTLLHFTDLTKVDNASAVWFQIVLNYIHIVNAT